MIVLLIFAFVSGFLTIFAPCIWPILPLVLSSSIGGSRKPLGVTLGIVISFAILTLFISYFIKLIPIDTNNIRIFAVIVISVMGLSLLIPKFSQVTEGIISKFIGKLNLVNNANSTGFGSGFIAGIALGVVWTPCAGPILATIATLAATQKLNIAIVEITTFYAIGTSLPLFIFAKFGNRLFTKTKSLSKYTGIIQQSLGFIMLVLAVLIVTNYDKVIEVKLLNFFPSYSNLLTSIESSNAIKTQLNNLKNTGSSDNSLNNSLFNSNYNSADFNGGSKWLNTNMPLSINNLKGNVVLVDFWTYTCINCIRTLPHVTSWYEKYKDKGFVVIGVHTPEFEFEHDTNNVLNAIKLYGINYPVVQDNDYKIWNNFNNQYWPAEYLIDKNGIIRRTHFGEGEYDLEETAIQDLLKEAGNKVSSKIDSMPDLTPRGSISPETYLNSERMEFYYPDGNTGNVSKIFTLNQTLPQNTFGYNGEWKISNTESTSGKNSEIIYNFYANKVYLVLNPGNSNNSQIQLFMDNKLIDPNSSGSDVVNGIVKINSDRLYNLVDLKGKTASHLLKIKFLTPGTKAFAFTFG